MTNSSFTIAAVQAAPVFLDLDATIEKTIVLIREAAGEGARLVVFPEAFVPGYPLWVWFIPSGQTHPLRDLYTRLHASSITIPGPETQALGAVAAELGVALASASTKRTAKGATARSTTRCSTSRPMGRSPAVGTSFLCFPAIVPSGAM